MVADKLEHAETLRSEALDLQLKYENRLADWQLEKEHLQKDVPTRSWTNGNQQKLSILKKN